MGVIEQTVHNVDQEQDLDTIGTLHWWSVSEALLDKRDLKDKWINSDLPSSLFRFKSSHSVKFNKARTRIMRNHSNVRIDPVKEFKDDKSLKYTINVREENEDGVHWIMSGNVYLNTSNGTIFAKSTHGVASEIIQEYNSAEDWLDDNDIRNLIKRSLIWLDGICVRERGGIYFVPQSRKDDLDNLSKFFSLINAAKLYILPILGTDKAKKDLGEDFEREVENEIRILNEEVDKGDLSNRIANNRIDKLQDIRKKTDMLVSLIDIKKEKILDSLTATEDKIRSQLLADS